MRTALTIAFAWICLLTPTYGQEFDLFQVEPSTTLQLGAQPKKATVSAALRPTDKPNVVKFELTLTIPDGANSYSQSKDFAKPTIIRLVNAKGWKPLDEKFVPKPKPKKQFDEVFGKEVEKLVGKTVFSRRYQAPAGTDVKSAKLSGSIDFLLCDEGSCTPQLEKFTAEYEPGEEKDSTAGVGDVPDLSELLKPDPVSVAPLPNIEIDSSESVAGDFRYGYQITPTRSGFQADPTQLQFELSPADAQPGDEVTLAITMLIEENWNTYGLEKADESQFELPTEIELSPVNLKANGDFISVPKPEVHSTTLGDDVYRSNSHSGKVTWLKKFTVQSDEAYGIRGSVKYQICEFETRCLPANKVEFSLGEGQLAAHIKDAVPMTEEYANQIPEPLIAENPPAEDESESETEDIVASLQAESEEGVTSLSSALGLAFLTGLIMNIMPCVLPVLAIKILSLVQQAGESRGRIIALNLSYTLGVMSVFFAFALLSWGVGQSFQNVFQNTTFWIVMACVVFTMGLSLFGVFELPVPGLLPSAHDHTEGFGGAFNSGIIATLLGIPCIGPFVTPFIPWTMVQPAPVVFSVFGMLGLGMASPYLLTGFFPALVNWLPKPGMWMVRFKQFTGFVMMGTVIFLMFSIPMEWRLPTLILLLGLGLLVWIMGTFADHSKPFIGQWKTYVTATVAALPVAYLGIYLMNSAAFRLGEVGVPTIAEGSEESGEMPWQPFSEEKLLSLRKEGRPMLIDFTASWCAVCITNEATALNTPETVAIVKENGFVPMVADFTREDPVIQKWLRRFGEESVPLTLVIPPGKDSKIIPLRKRFYQEDVLDALETALENQNSERQTAQVDTIDAPSVN